MSQIFKMLKIISPTGLGIRDQDKWGLGKFGASRGKGRLHHGVDFICEPGQRVISPINGKIIREARPYSGKHYSGLLISDGVLSVKLFYFQPSDVILRILDGGRMIPIDEGKFIGIAQDISEMYPEMIPHVHLEARINPTFLLDEAINPEILV